MEEVEGSLSPEPGLELGCRTETWAGPGLFLACTVCQLDPVSQPVLLACLHLACQSCTRPGGGVECGRCGVATPAPLPILCPGPPTSPGPPGPLAAHLAAAQAAAGEVAGRAAVLQERLSGLADLREAGRAAVEETAAAGRTAVVAAREAALVQLETRHRQAELQLMEQLAALDRLEGSASQATAYTAALLAGEGEPAPALTSQAANRLARLVELCGEAEPKPAPTPVWQADSAALGRAVQQHFGRWSGSGGGFTGRAGTSPSLVVTQEEDGPVPDLVSALLSPAPALLPLGPLPSSPLPPVIKSHQNSPARQLGLGLAGLPRLQSPVTLADLISGCEDECGGLASPGWGRDTVEAGRQFSSNLAALASSLEPGGGGGGDWTGGGGGLLLPSLSRSLSNLGSDASPGPHSLVSPGPGLSPVLLGPHPTLASPVSPGISPDSLLPGLASSLALSPAPPLSRNAPVSPQHNRPLNPMQIRCKFGQLGPSKGQFNSPHGFCLGSEEEIVVADTNNHRIQVFEKNGTYRYQFGVPGKEEGQLWYPRKVAVMKPSGKFVVCDRGNERSRMQIFTKHGHFVRKIAIRYIDIVAGLAITRDGNIVAVDSVTPTMFVISEAGELLRWFDCADYMREPSDIAVGGREFYVCDFKGHTVVVFTEDGNFVRRIGCENITNFPNGIDISDAGDILIGDSHGNRFHVVVFSSDGSLLAEFECPHVKVSRCCGLKITSEGYVVTLAKNNHHVLVLNTLYIA